VLTAIDSLVFARAERRAVKRQLDQAEQRFEVGLTAITDVHEARARYDGARASAITAANNLDNAREVLSEITGQYLQGFKGLGETFEPQLPEPAAAEQWVQQALANNPGLLSRELALLAAGHDIDTARAAHLPTLSASVGFGDDATWGSRGSNDVSFPASASNDGHTIGLTLRVPIFEGFGTQAQVRQSVYNRDAVADQFEQERRAVTRQTRNAYRALEAGISEIGARMQALVSARSALEATEAGFEVGTRTIVDVLLSQQQLFQAQRNFSESRHTFLVNTLRLRQAAGSIAVADIQNVNRFLVSDAEAALAEGESDDESDRTL
jgi:outer membrane protein